MTGQDRTSAQVWSKKRVNLNEPFSLEFYAYLGDAKADPVADGIALTFRNGNDYFVGNGGMGMGSYSDKLGKAHTLEIDTYYNPLPGQPTNIEDTQADYDIYNHQTYLNNHVGHVAIRTSDEAGRVSPHRVLSWGTYENPIANGNWNKVIYKWNPEANNGQGSISIEINGQIIEDNYNIRNDVSDPTNVIWGLTSSTAIYASNQGVYFTNLDFGYGLRIEKVDSVTGHPLSGAVFNLLNENKEEILTGLVSDDNGIIIVEDLKPGKYFLVELKAPDGYKLLETEKEIIISPTETEFINIKYGNDKIPTGKLETSKTADKENVKVGDIITYTINAKNTVKDSLLDPVIITDNLPEGLELVADSVVASDEKAKVEVDGNQIKVTFNNVAGETSVKVTFQAKVTEKAGKTVKNVALVEGTDSNNPDKPVDPEQPEVETPVTPVIPTGKLETSKTADKEKVKVGEIITYTINAKNTVKDSLLDPVIITDNLPEGLELVADSVVASDEKAKVEVDGNQIKVTFNKVSISNLKGGTYRLAFRDIIGIFGVKRINQKK